MVDQRNEYVGYTVNKLSSGDRPATPDDEQMWGFMPLGVRISTTNKTCLRCGYTTEPVSEHRAIDLYEGIFGEGKLPWQ